MTTPRTPMGTALGLTMTDLDPNIIEALLEKRENLSTKHPFFKALVYGESGFGKTVFAAQLAQAITPPDKTIEYIDFLEGWVSLLNHTGLTARTNRQQYEGLSQIEFLAKAIKANVEPFNKIGTVIVDELSGMTKGDLDVVFKARVQKDASKDPFAPTQPDYYANTERSRRAVTELMQANVNVIFVAHIREDKLSNGLVVTRPSFMPAFSDIFRQMMHMVVFLSAQEFASEDGEVNYKRAFQVHPTRSISAKTRVGGLPVSMEAGALIQAIQEWMEGNRDSEELGETSVEGNALERETGIEVTGENLEIHPDSDSESDTEEIHI